MTAENNLVMKQSVSAYAVVGKAAWTFADACCFYVSRTALPTTHSRASQVHGVETVFHRIPQRLWQWNVNCENHSPAMRTVILTSKLQLALYFFYAMQRRCFKYSHHLSILYKNFVFIPVPIPLGNFGLSSFHVRLGPFSGLSVYCLCWLFK